MTDISNKTLIIMISVALIVSLVSQFSINNEGITGFASSDGNKIKENVQEQVSNLTEQVDSDEEVSSVPLDDIASAETN